MSSLNDSNELILYYTKVLEDLKNLELKAFDSDETSENENELTKFRRDLCDCNNQDKTAEDSTQTETNKANQLTSLKIKKFYDDLNSNDCSLELAEKLFKLIAELAKDEKCRDLLVEQNLFKPINKFLISEKSSDLVKTQLCRAIGNLCYYNDKGRLSFYDECGLQSFFDLCKYCTLMNFTNELTEEKIKEKNTLIMVAIGCLHNITNENETLRKEALKLNVMSLFKDFIPFLKNEKGILVHFLSAFENLTELDEGKEQFVKEKVALKLYENLNETILSELDDYTEDFFTILSSINEINMSKEFLCQTDFLEKLISFVERNTEDNDYLRNVGLFLTNLLAKDDKIDMIFEYKNNLILNKAMNWLSDSNNEQLYVTSAVIIANYMRNDQNSLKMIQNENQPHVKIISLLKKYNKLESEPTFQQINVTHSLLTTLRNFCIATSSRDELLKHNVIEVVLEFLNFENLEVKWKALSIIRLLVKACTEKTGLSLIFDKTVLEKIENIANNPQDHAGVAGESSRLVCYLPIAAKSEKNIGIFCNQKTMIDVIVKQLKSEHFIMLNEALLAINVLITVDYRACCEQFKSSKLNDHLKDLLNKESLPIEMRSNALKIFKFLFDRNDFFTEDQLKEYLALLKKLKLNTDNEFIKNHINQLINLIDNVL